MHVESWDPSQRSAKEDARLKMVYELIYPGDQSKIVDFLEKKTPRKPLRNLLTLTSDGIYDIKRLHSYGFIGPETEIFYAEKNIEIFNKIYSQLIGLGIHGSKIHPFNSNILKLESHQLPDSLDLVNLDFCGFFSPTLFAWIFSVIEHKLTNGFLVLNYFRNRRGTLSRVLRLFDYVKKYGGAKNNFFQTFNEWLCANHPDGKDPRIDKSGEYKLFQFYISQIWFILAVIFQNRSPFIQQFTYSEAISGISKPTKMCTFFCDTRGFEFTKSGFNGVLPDSFDFISNIPKKSLLEECIDFLHRNGKLVEELKELRTKAKEKLKTALDQSKLL